MPTVSDAPSRPKEVCGGAFGKEYIVEELLDGAVIADFWRAPGPDGRMFYHRWLLVQGDGWIGWVCMCGKRARPH